MSSKTVVRFVLPNRTYSMIKKLQDLIFTMLMVFSMAFPISVYNHSLEASAFSIADLSSLIRTLAIPYVFALIYEMLIVKPLAFRLCRKCIQSSFPAILQTIIRTFFMVSLMCTTMTLFITLWQPTCCSSIPSSWYSLFLQTYPFAFFWQLLIAGPLVRKTTALLFNRQ